jgi:hypothetical protein
MGYVQQLEQALGGAYLLHLSWLATTSKNVWLQRATLYFITTRNRFMSADMTTERGRKHQSKDLQTYEGLTFLKVCHLNHGGL